MSQCRHVEPGEERRRVRDDLRLVCRAGCPERRKRTVRQPEAVCDARSRQFACEPFDDRLLAPVVTDGAGNGDEHETGLGDLDPPPLGDVELADAVERIGDRIFIKGNIDSVNTLLFRTAPEIRSRIRNRNGCSTTKW